MRILLATLMLGLLAGCSSAATPAPPPSASSATDTATDTDTEAAEVAVVIRSVGLEVWEDDALVETRSWFDDVAGTVDLLGEVFGSAPVEGERIIHSSAPPLTEYAWDGFALRVAAHPAKAPTSPNQSVSVSADAVGDVAIRTVDGLQVGAAPEAVDAASPFAETCYPDFPTCQRHVDRVDVPETVGASPDEAGWNGVALTVPAAGGPVSEISAPSMNYGE